MPFEVPEGWCITDIGELLINRDGERKPVSLAIRSKQKNKVYDYYGAAGVIDKVDNYLFDECLLLIGEDGANLLSRNKNNAFLADGKYWVNNHAHVLDAIDKFILSYVAIVINSMKLDDYITGSAQPKLSQDNLNKIPIILPPLNEQKRIVTELERWFALIDHIEQGKVDLRETVKQTKSKILDLAIHGKLVPQDPNDEPAIELLKRINPDFTPCDNGHYPFEIPNVWQWCTINDISEVITGSTPSKNNIEYYGGNFPFYKPTDLDTGRHVMKASEYLTEKGKSVSRIIPPKSIAICCIGSIGKTGYIEVEGTTNQQINTIVPKKNLLNSVYGYYTCISDYFVNKLINSSSAITISIINKSKLQSVIFPLPPLAEQQRIVQKIEELFSELDNIQKALEV